MQDRFLIAAAVCLVTTAAHAEVKPLVSLFDYPVFQGDAPDANHAWAVHDRNRPQAPVVVPGTFSTQEAPGQPPADAIVLFDGTEAALQNWESTRQNGAAPMGWKAIDGNLVVTPRTGNIRTKQQFGDVQLHLEWSVDADVTGEGQGRANSGVFLPGDAEIQILDNYNNLTYADGSAGSVYGVNPPMVNPLRQPGQWQVYDIVFRRPVFKDGVEVDPGRFTVFINGVLVQDSTPLEGGGGHMKRSKSREFPATGPIALQDHGNVLRFRNIWVRPLPPRAVEGGTDGHIGPEAAMAKREETAAGIRAHAATLEGRPKMLRLMESLVYAPDAAALESSTTMITAEVAAIEAMSAEDREKNKAPIQEFKRALDYLARFDALPKDHPSIAAIAAVIKAQGWNEKK
jgi:hypothetical protein